MLIINERGVMKLRTLLECISKDSADSVSSIFVRYWLLDTLENNLEEVDDSDAREQISNLINVCDHTFAKDDLESSVSRKVLEELIIHLYDGLNHLLVEY